MATRTAATSLAPSATSGGPLCFSRQGPQMARQQGVTGWPAAPATPAPDYPAAYAPAARRTGRDIRSAPSPRSPSGRNSTKRPAGSPGRPGGPCPASSSRASTPRPRLLARAVYIFREHPPTPETRGRQAVSTRFVMPPGARVAPGLEGLAKEGASGHDFGAGSFG